MTEKNMLQLPCSLTLVIFGGSGDLTMRKLIPSLLQLYQQGHTPEKLSVLGLGRTRYSDEDYRNHLLEALQKYLKPEEFDREKAVEFLRRVFYLNLDPEKEGDYEMLRDYLKELDRETDSCGNYIFYLATPPSLYGVVPKHLIRVGLNDIVQEDADSSYLKYTHDLSKCKHPIRRIVIEKPFGYDLESARRLTDIYQHGFYEDQLYRIDHYLGKETVQNIMALRFANGFFEPLWNRNYIKCVEITAVENMGVEGRGGYYDNSGALRDMVQNHLAQLVALTAMEPPVQFDAEHFRNEVVKVYQSFRPLKEGDVHKNVVRGQYTSAEWKGEMHKGYREEDKVSLGSRTETFLAMKLFIDNWRWHGVPFYLRTGKMMPTKVSEIIIHFHPTPHQMFGTRDGTSVPNQLIIRLQPNEGIVLKFAAKVPGSGFEVKKTSMDFTYDSIGGLPTTNAYARLLEDAMLGDPTLFTRSDAVEASWKFFDPILKAWETDPSIPLYGYPAGTWGPLQSHEIMDDPTQTWTNPCRNLTQSDLYCEL